MNGVVPAARAAGVRPGLLEAFASTHDRLFSYVARRLGPDTAEDIVGETFALACARWETYDPARGAVAAWLFGIAVNLLRRQRRDERRQWRAYARTGVDPLASHDPDIDERIDAASAARDLAAALVEMKSRDREALLLYAWAELSYEEIAAALGIPIGTVRSRLSRARRILRAHLEENHERS
jgi:RNA polymerase sigma-70 factor (ECF subfamily)